MFNVRLAFSRGPRGSSAEYDTAYFSLGENSMSRTCITSGMTLFAQSSSGKRQRVLAQGCLTLVQKSSYNTKCCAGPEVRQLRASASQLMHAAQQ